MSKENSQGIDESKRSTVSDPRATFMIEASSDDKRFFIPGGRQIPNQFPIISRLMDEAISEIDKSKLSQPDIIIDDSSTEY